MKPTNYTPTLLAILQGAKFKATQGINGILNTYQLEEISGSLWLIKFKSGRYREETAFCVDKAITKNDTLVLETSVLGKRCEVVIICKTDVELIKDE
jgi:hypothetical protein